MSRVVTVTQFASGWAEVRFEYDATLVSLLESLPRYSRMWDNGRKVWTIKYAEFVELFVTRAHQMRYLIVGYQPRQQQRQSTPPPKTNTAAVEDWAAVLFRAVGEDRPSPSIGPWPRRCTPTRAATRS